MFYLLGSIILTSYLTLSFKILERLHINNFQAIVFNYFTCVVTGSLVNGSFPITGQSTSLPWFPWALLMGATFIGLFNLVALTTQRIGVAVATVANKLSLVIPFVFSILFYRESFSRLNVAGILIAMVAVIFTCYRKPDLKTEKKSLAYLFYLLPMVVFLGSGVLDTMIKYVEQRFLVPSNYDSYLVTAFAMAASTGAVLLVIFILSGRQRFSYKSVIAGIAIGIPNYFSIWCLLKVLKQHMGKSAVVIPVNNMGIVLFSAVVAWLAFNEKLTGINWLGILLSILSIALIAFG